MDENKPAQIADPDPRMTRLRALRQWVIETYHECYAATRNEQLALKLTEDILEAAQPDGVWPSLLHDAIR